MGSLRTVFALSVVFAHSWLGGPVFVGGQLAVQLFYIISGFLISYVLVEGKRYSNLHAFYINRYLRLFPIYAAVAVVTLICFRICKNSTFFEIYKTAPNSAVALLTFSNIFLFGQDWVMFAGVDNGSLAFTKDFLKSSVILYEGLLVPQAWTLGVELSFYLIAPFILKRRKIVFVTVALSLLLRAYLIKIGVGTKDPWTYRFFPTELALFLLGSLAHQILLPWYRKSCRTQLPLFASVATYFLVGISLVYFLIPIKEVWKAAIFIAIFLLLVPFTFEFQDRHRLDNWIGNLSYPIYVGHVLVIYLVSVGFRTMGIDNRYVYSLTCVVLAVVFAILLNRCIGAPFERIRDKFRKPP